MRVDYAKLLSLGALHMGQYFPAAFTAIALPALFRKAGLPLEMFWLLALPGIPRWLKWLIALGVDNYGSARIGFRKSWIIPCTLLGTLLYFSLSFLEPTLAMLDLIVAILFVKSFIMAAQDVAVDGFATESLTDADRTVGTSIIIFLAALGGLIGASLTAVVETLGWRSTMMIASGLLLAVALPAIFRTEPPPPIATRNRRAMGERASLLKALLRPEARYILPYLLAYGFAGAFISALFTAFLVDKGVSLTQIGMLLPIAGFVGAGLGALVTPLVVGYLGLRGAGLVGVICVPIEGATFAWLSTLSVLPGLGVLTALFASIFFAGSIYTYAVNNSRFRWSSTEQAATDFSTQSSIWNFGGWAAGSVAGFVAAWFGYTAFFVIGALVSTAVAAWYVFLIGHIEPLLARRETEQRQVDAVSEAA